MPNICKNKIMIIGLKEEPQQFAKTLSKLVLGVDLDNMDPKRWGEDPSIDGTSWYSKLVDEFRREGVSAARYGVLYPQKPYEKLGVSAPRYYLETKYEPPVDALSNASKTSPELTFHLDFCVLQDGPVGAFIVKNGRVVEEFTRRGSWNLFDWPILYPTVSLLPAHLPYTLAQRGALRVEDAIDIIKQLRLILDDNRFIDSPCQAYRDQKRVEQTRQALDGLLDQMQSTAQQLTFEGVFINDPRSRTLYDHEERSPGGPVGDYERRADSTQPTDAVPKAAHERATASEDV